VFGRRTAPLTFGYSIFLHNNGIDMSKVTDKYFSQVNKEKIQAAVKTAERETSGEIVPYVVEMSDFYEVAEWRAAGILGVIALGVFAWVRRFTNTWLPIDLAEIALIVIL
jgi:uncharacterized membrane protein